MFLVVFFLIFVGLKSQRNSLTGGVIQTDYSDNVKTPQDQFSGSTELHYTHMPITYSIGSSCGNYQGKRIRTAFSEFSSETGGLINFSEVSDSADIVSHCSADVPNGNVSNTYRAGDGGYYSSSNVITQGTLNFYNINEDIHNYDGGCLSYPDIEIHEILHTFGFQHITDRKSIMNPMSNNCYVRKIDSQIIDELKLIYS